MKIKFTTAVLSTVIFCAVFFLFSGSAFAAQWLWQADNHMENFSYFTDGKTYFETVTQGDWQWAWDDPTTSTVSLRGPMEKMGRGFARSSDFGEALNVIHGITLSARVKPIGAHSRGTLCISVANKSTAGLKGDSPHLWIGWDVPDSVYICNRNGVKLKSFKSSVNYESTWCIWTLSAKRLGDTVAWDIWINGVHQGADQQAPDGTFHTILYTKNSDMGTSLRIGQRDFMLYPHDTVWDYVAITNEGVIPGWSGDAGIARHVEPEPAVIRPECKAIVECHKTIMLLRLGHTDEAALASAEAFATYNDPLISAAMDRTSLKELWNVNTALAELHYASASTKEAYGDLIGAIADWQNGYQMDPEEKSRAAVAYCIANASVTLKQYEIARSYLESILENPSNEVSGWREAAKYLKVLTYYLEGRYYEAVPLLRDLISTTTRQADRDVAQSLLDSIESEGIR